MPFVCFVVVVYFLVCEHPQGTARKRVTFAWRNRHSRGFYNFAQVVSSNAYVLNGKNLLLDPLYIIHTQEEQYLFLFIRNLWNIIIIASNIRAVIAVLLFHWVKDISTLHHLYL